MTLRTKPPTFGDLETTDLLGESAEVEDRHEP
jgi:hypothetical protein